LKSASKMDQKLAIYNFVWKVTVFDQIKKGVCSQSQVKFTGCISGKVCGVA
jgi:hypothetical protein